MTTPSPDESGPRPEPYKVLPDVDSGGWWVCGPTTVKTLPKYVLHCREIMDIMCENLNVAYESAKAQGREGKSRDVCECWKPDCRLTGKTPVEVEKIWRDEMDRQLFGDETGLSTQAKMDIEKFHKGDKLP